MDMYRIALLLLRLAGATYTLIGTIWLLCAAAIFVSVIANLYGTVDNLFDAALPSLMTYGLMDFVAGIAILVFSRRIAGWAARF